MKYLYSTKYWKINKEYDIDKILYLMADRPNYDYDNEFIWENSEEQLDRKYNFPSYAYVCSDGTYSLYWAE